MADKRKVKFIRIRGRIVPIRQKVSDHLGALSSSAAVGAGLYLGLAKTIEHKKFGKFRAAAIKRTHKNMLRKPVRAALSSPFRFRRVAGRLGKISGALGILSFAIGPEQVVNEALGLKKGE